MFSRLCRDRLETPGVVLKDGQLQCGGAMEERESPRPGLTDHCMLPTFASPKGYKSSLVDSCNSSSVLLVSPLVAFMF